LKRKILKVKRIKRYSPFANAILYSKHPMDVFPISLGEDLRIENGMLKQNKGYGRVRTKPSHKHNN